MHGLIVKMKSTEGDRDQLAAVLLGAMTDLPGCLSYVVANDTEDDDALWVSEVWTNSAAHASSLSMPGVQEAIQRAKPILAGFEERIITEPVGGLGIEPGAAAADA